MFIKEYDKIENSLLGLVKYIQYRIDDNSLADQISSFLKQDDINHYFRDNALNEQTIIFIDLRHISGHPPDPGFSNTTTGYLLKRLPGNLLKITMCEMPVNYTLIFSDSYRIQCQRYKQFVKENGLDTDPFAPWNGFYFVTFFDISGHDTCVNMAEVKSFLKNSKKVVKIYNVNIPKTDDNRV